MFTSIDQDRSAKAEGHAPASSTAYFGPERRRKVAAAFDPVFVGRFVWRCRWLIASTTLAGFAFAGTLAATTPKTWLAGTQILVDPRDLKVVQNEVAPNALPSDATLALIESQTAVVTSDRVLSAVIRSAGLLNDPEFNGTGKSGLLTLLPESVQTSLGEARPSPDETYAHVTTALRRALTVAREPKSFIVNLSLTTEDAEKSARLANALADAFIAELGRIQSDTARRATVALSSRLAELRRSVVEAEEKVEDYKNRNSLIGVNGRLVDDDYITRINDELARTRASITALRVKAQSLSGTDVDDVVKGGLPEEAGSEALTRLRQAYSDLLQQQAGLATRLGPKHPQRVAVDGAASAARDSIRRELARIVAAGQTELARAEATERDLTREVSDLKSKQAETSSSFVKLRELQREVDASRAVYEAFLLRTRETSEQESLNTANIRVISEAMPPLRPAGPSRKLIALGGVIGGFALGFGLAIALAMVRLLIGFLRQDRRRAQGGAERAIWSEAERAARRRATMPAEPAAPVEPVSVPAAEAAQTCPEPLREDVASTVEPRRVEERPAVAEDEVAAREAAPIGKATVAAPDAALEEARTGSSVLRARIREIAEAQGLGDQAGKAERRAQPLDMNTVRDRLNAIRRREADRKAS